MADPVLQGVIRATTRFQGISGKPEDSFVNSWAFRGVATNATYEQNAIEVQGALHDFFALDTTAGALAVAEHFSSDAIDEASGIEIRTYDLGQGTPREPTISIESCPSGQSPGLPNEVALCLSFYADRNLPRQRGRVYLGPLGGTAAVVQSLGGERRPTTTFMSTVRAAAIRLMNHATVEWGVISQVDGLFRPITGGWVDDAFDTQRRRGFGATQRLVFPDVP